MVCFEKICCDLPACNLILDVLVYIWVMELGFLSGRFCQVQTAAEWGQNHSVEGGSLFFSEAQLCQIGLSSPSAM